VYFALILETSRIELRIIVRAD